jgi:hypothetical protein
MASLNIMGYLPIKLFNKEVDLDTDTIKLMLLSSSATPNVDVHVYIEDLEGDEVSGSGYSAGGETVSNISISYISGSNTCKFDADDVVFSAVTISTRYGVLYDEDSSVIIAYLDFDSEQSPSASDFTVSFNADGMFTAVV